MAERKYLDDLRIDRSAEPLDNPWRVRLALLALSILLVAGATWWFLAGAGPIEVEVASVREQQAGTARASVLDASGYVVARRQATISSKVTGRLAEVTVEEGVGVKAGQILARLDDSNAQRALQLAEARLAAARSSLEEVEVRLRQADIDLRRTRDLVGRGIESQSAYDRTNAERDSLAARLEATRAEAKVAERELDVRRQEVEDTLVRAPFDGVAVSKDAQPGEIVSPISAGGGFTRTGISTIVDMSSLEIEVDVNEAFIQRVRPKQPVQATLQAYPDWKIPAHVITTVPAADRQKATVKVRIAFAQLDDPRILPDMGVKVAFQSEDGAAPDRARLLVAERAIRADGGNNIVFVVREDHVERRAIAVGGKVGDEVEVQSGLRNGEQVVVDPPAELTDGNRIRRREEARKG